MKKSIKKVALVLTMILAVSCLFGCGKKKENEFVVGFDAEFPPYGYIGEDGEYVGFDLDLAREVARRNNWKIELKAINWDAKDSEQKQR